MSPSTSRRRPVLLSDNIHNSNAPTALHPLDNLNPAPAPATKDVSHHSLPTPKRTPAKANPTVFPRRLRPNNPWWLTAIRIFAKNFLLLILILGLVQLIRNLSLQTSGTDPLALADFQGRIAQVEGLFKKTSQMIQLQLDVVDKKVDARIGSLRTDLLGRMKDGTSSLDSDLKRHEAKTETLEGYLAQLKGKQWLPKQDFDRFLEKAKGGLGSTSLDDIKAYARDVVLKEINKHAADGLALPDYALATAGAIISSHSDPYAVGKGAKSSSSRNGVQADAYKMLRSSFGEPGACFPLKGNSGFVEIMLRTAIIPKAVTLEHVAKSVAYDRSSAPKDCRVSGWFRGNSESTAVGADKKYLLAEFTYDLEKSNAQTFNFRESAVGPGIIDTVRLDFGSNQGSPTHTCIYRFRVHGHVPSTASLLPMQS